MVPNRKKSGRSWIELERFSQTISSSHLPPLGCSVESGVRDCLCRKSFIASGKNFPCHFPDSTLHPDVNFVGHYDSWLGDAGRFALVVTS